MSRAVPFVCGLMGASLGLAVGWWLAGSPPETSASSAGLETLHGELRAIRQLLEERPPRSDTRRTDALRSGAVEPLSRSLAGVEDDRVEPPSDESYGPAAAADRLEQLLRKIEDNSAVSGTHPDDDESVATNLTAIREYRAVIPENSDVPHPSLFGRSRMHVYRRFGTPSYVYISDGSVAWHYDDPLARGPMVVTFVDGYVAHVVSYGG